MNEFKMIHHVDQKTIAAMYEEYSPVFILSTGRSGSKFVVELLNLSPVASAFHEPRPALQYFSNFACGQQEQPEMLSRIIDAARMEMVLETYISGKVFIESNQCLTFFAPVLSGLFKNAKFVHLLRHPGDFVASAARKGWYSNDSIWESGRPKPASAAIWHGWTLVQKLGWLWDASNGFLRNFSRGLNDERVRTCRLEDLVADTDRAAGLFAFCGVPIPAKNVITDMQAKKINRLWVDPQEPSNMHKDPGFPAYGDWPVTMKNELWQMVGATAAGFGYKR
jgi:hypothetical protein